MSSSKFFIVIRDGNMIVGEKDTRIFYSACYSSDSAVECNNVVMEN